MPAPAEKFQKNMIQPIGLIFRFLQSRARIQVWLHGRTSFRIEGEITGFDEYMNIVLLNAAEIYVKTGDVRKLGRIVLKGDCITLITSVQ